jgi:hypothetical protein
MVALGLLTIFIGGVTGVFMAGLRTAGSANHRTDASSLATREIEAMHAVPYGNLGFYNDQTAYVATFEGYTTVSLRATTPAGSPSATQPQTPDPSAAPNFNPDPDATNANPIALVASGSRSSGTSSGSARRAPAARRIRPPTSARR